MSCCEDKSCDTKNLICNCKCILKAETCTSIVECCADSAGVKYCICVCKCGDEVCVSIIDCENDIPSDTKELDTAGGREIPCNAKCFVDGDTCVAVIDCCNDLPEKPKNYVYAVKCNGKIFKSQCGGAKSFKCTCKCSLNGSSCDVSLDCCRGNIGDTPKKCICVCDCGKAGGICVNIKNCNSKGDAGKDVANNCDCKCFSDKGVCVAVLKCCKRGEDATNGCTCNLSC